jgi:putative membrane protein
MTVHDIADELDKQDEWPQRSLVGYLGIFVRGMTMGSADIVPGVSGGTMAFIFGIYEELIDSIRTIGQPHFINAVLHLRLREAFSMLNWKFLLALGLGVVTAIFTLAGPLEHLLVNYPVYIWSFFFGLVVASVFVVSRRVRRWTPVLFLALAGGAVGAYFLVGLVPLQTPDVWWFYLLSGALASCAMILPGISGAYILLLLGKYQDVLSAVNQRDFLTLFFIAAGAAIGLVTFAQILHYLFKRYHDATVAVLIGLMVGSLRKIWPWKVNTAWLTDANGNAVLDSAGERIITAQQNILPSLTNGPEITEFVFALLLAAAGIALVLFIEYIATRSEAQKTAAGVEPTA